MTNFDLEKYRGKRVDVVKAELEALGYNVIINNNSNSRLDDTANLVVLARFTNEKTIEIVAGEFKFLS